MPLSSSSRLSREHRFWLWAKPLSLSSPAPPGDGPLEERTHRSAAAVPGPSSSAMRSARRPRAAASTTREASRVAAFQQAPVLLLDQQHPAGG